jgi:hypothetical protein
LNFAIQKKGYANLMTPLKGGNKIMLKKVAIAVVLCMFVAVSVSAQQRGIPEEA